MRVLLACALLLLAGCSGPGGSDAPDPSPEGSDAAAGAEDTGAQGAPIPMPLVVTTVQQGLVGTEAASWIAGPQDTEGWNLEFAVEEGATGLVIEVLWTDDVQDLDTLLDSPGDCFEQTGFPDGIVPCFADIFIADGEYGTWWNQDGHVGAPDHPARIELGASTMDHWGPGTWDVTVWTKDANTDVAFTIYATVLYGPDAAGFTALP